MRTARARSQGDDICMIVCRDSAHQGVRAQVAAVPDAVFYMLLSHGLARHSIRSIAAFRRLRSPRLELKIEDAAPENLNSMRMWWWWEETLVPPHLPNATSAVQTHLSSVFPRFPAFEDVLDPLLVVTPPLIATSTVSIVSICAFLRFKPTVHIATHSSCLLSRHHRRLAGTLLLHLRSTALPRRNLTRLPNPNRSMCSLTTVPS